jgi:predicted ribosome quality control (RQC) complex YloA/Tae2 family protein
MKIKHKLLADYQYTTSDKKIIVLKSGTILEEYSYKLKGDSIQIDKDIIEANPELFILIDWKSELLTYIKANKLPTPAVLTKKLIPFIEEMVLSNAQPVVLNTPVIDENKVRELEARESSISIREKVVKEKEDEIEIRLKRIEKRENEFKEDLKLLDKRDEEIRERSKELVEKTLDIEEKMQSVNNKERELDRSSMEKSKEIDDKYKKLQEKIDNDLKNISEREREISLKLKEFNDKEYVNENEKKLIDEQYRLLEMKVLEIYKFSGLHSHLDFLISEIKNTIDQNKKGNV